MTTKPFHALIAAALTAVGLSAQTPKAADLFAGAPASVYPLLDRTTRLDMIDYAANNMSTPSRNNLNGQSVITALSPETLMVKMTDSSTSQLAVLPAKGDKIVVAVISTIATPGLDSSISFYTPAWAQLKTADYFAKPEWKDWIAPGGDLATVTSMTPFMLASYYYDPATATLTITNNLDKFLDKDIYEIISPSLLQTLTYTWDGKKFSKK